MKKHILTLTLLSALAATASAKPIDPDSARNMAARLIANPIDATRSVGHTTLAAGSATQKPGYYFFRNADNKGFAIVAADDRLGTILGYSADAPSDAQNMPEGLRSLLDAYTRAAESISVDTVSLTPAYAKRPKAYVEPLVKAEWDQSYPYNYYTHTSSGATAYTGCVNTAVAQAMSAHQWPLKRPESMISGEGAMALDHYDWDNIIPSYSGSYTDTQAQAVGALIHDVAVLSNSTFGTSFTTSNEGYAWIALENYFGYSVREIEKDVMRGGEYLETVYQELSEGCPLVVSGSNHAFVYDGYDTAGNVHINWGWSGSYNGYYDINVVANNGAGSGSNGLFYEEQHALMLRPRNGKHDIFPTQPAILIVGNTKGLYFSESQTTTSGKLSVNLKSVGARNLASGTNGTYKGNVGVGLFDRNGVCLHVFPSPYPTQKWSSYFETKSFGDEWQLDLSTYTDWNDGEYYLSPLCHRVIDEAAGEWEGWQYMYNANQVSINVAGNTVSVVADPGVPELHLVGQPEILTPVIENNTAAIAVKIANTSRYEAHGSVKLTFYGTGSLEGETYEAPTALLSHFVASRNDTTQWLFPFAVSYTSTNGSGAMKAGNYRMQIVFNNNQYTEKDTVFTFDVPEDFLVKVYPSSYKGRVMINNVWIQTDGKDAETLYFHPDETPEVQLGVSARATYFSENSYSTYIRYRLRNLATGTDALTSQAYRVSLPWNEDTNLSSSTRYAVDLTSLAPGKYEIHVDVDHNDEWIDTWNTNNFRRVITVLENRPSTFQLQFSESDYLTLYTDRAYTLPEGVKAYQVSDTGELLPVGENAEGDVVVAANSALLLQAAMGDTYTVNYSDEPGIQSEGCLHGAVVDVMTFAGNEDVYYYKLGYDADGVQVGFYYGAADGGAFVSKGGACYLALPKGTVPDEKVQGFALTETPSTAVHSLPTVSARSAAVYDLSGRRVSRMTTPGIYIVNGKKVVK